MRILERRAEKRLRDVWLGSEPCGRAGPPVAFGKTRAGRPSSLIFMATGSIIHCGTGGPPVFPKATGGPPVPQVHFPAITSRSRFFRRRRSSIRIQAERNTTYTESSGSFSGSTRESLPGLIEFCNHFLVRNDVARAIAQQLCQPLAIAADPRRILLRNVLQPQHPVNTFGP